MMRGWYKIWLRLISGRERLQGLNGIWEKLDNASYAFRSQHFHDRYIYEVYLHQGLEPNLETRSCTLRGSSYKGGIGCRRVKDCRPTKGQFRSSETWKMNELLPRRFDVLAVEHGGSCTASISSHRDSKPARGWVRWLYPSLYWLNVLQLHWKWDSISWHENRTCVLIICVNSRRRRAEYYRDSHHVRLVPHPWINCLYIRRYCAQFAGKTHRKGFETSSRCL